MTRRGLRFGLYFVADSELLPDKEIFRVTEAALAGGVALVQHRAKNLSPAESEMVIRRLLELTDRFNVDLVVNDLPELVTATGAAGVHLGQDDMPVTKARHILGQGAIIGATTPTPELAQQAEAEGASYVSVGPVFPSPTKREKPPVGPERVRAVRAATELPVCAIGGITAENVGELAGCGVQLVAVVSEIGAATAPRQAAEAAIEAMKRAGLPGPLWS